MPATSRKQKRFMDAAAHNPAFAKQAGIPQSVAKDFSQSSKGLKLKSGPTSRPDLQRINKPETAQGKNELFKKGGDTMASKMNPGFMAMMAKKKATFEKSGKDTEKKGVKEGSKKDMMMDKMQMKKMAGGGLAAGHKAADGIAKKGKTKGTDIAMKKGGMSRGR
jgi:hypothetical protein